MIFLSRWLHFLFGSLEHWFNDSFDLDAIEMNLFVTRTHLEPLATILDIRIHCLTEAAKIAAAQPSFANNQDYRDWRRAEVTIWLKHIEQEHSQGIWFDAYED